MKVYRAVAFSSSGLRSFPCYCSASENSAATEVILVLALWTASCQ
jgi:hypothetical protein